MSTSRLILHAYFLTDKKKKPTKQLKRLLDYNRKHHPNDDFLTPLAFYLDLLDSTNPALFPYLGIARKKQLLRDLQVTYLFLLAQEEYERTHQKKENKKKYNAQIKQCQQLIDLLEEQQDVEGVQKPLPHQYTSPEKPVAYLGLSFGQLFAQYMVSLADRGTKSLQEVLGAFNQERLYWVWSSGFIKTMLELLPQDYFFKTKAQIAIATPDLYTGTISWALYYFRFALQLGLLLKHTIRHPWMSKEERETPWTERFKTQWAQRKFMLLNDFFWAMGNLACFWWLCGKGALGTWGDILTLGLLCFDITIAVWDYEEQKTQYEKAMADYTEKIEELNNTIQILEENVLNDKAKQLLTELKTQRTAIQRQKDQCERQWHYKNIQLWTNIAYALGLMLAFALLTAPFCPFAPGVLAAMAITGVVLCFAFSVIANGIKKYIGIHEINRTAKEVKADLFQKLKEFKQLQKKYPDSNNAAKKLAFLEIKGLMIDDAYYKKMHTYQTLGLVKSVLIESLIPAIVFLSLVFLPLGSGLTILGAALGLAITTHILLNTVFKPKKDSTKKFDEKEYALFCDDPDNFCKMTTKKPSFFQTASAESQEAEQYEPPLIVPSSSQG